MNNLPTCKFRLSIIDNKTVECSCPSLMHAKEGVATVDTCLYPCPYRDERTAVAAKDSPALYVKAVNYLWSLTQHAIAGFPVVTEEQFKARLTICVSCELKHPTKMECTDCGCPLEELTAWADKECPLKKWGKEKGKKFATKPGCSSCPKG